MSLLHGRLLPLAIAAIALVTAGCISVDVGKDTGQQTQFRIDDGNSAPQPAARSTGRELVVAPQPSTSVDDSFSLAYSREPNQRAAYQFATWSDRPSSRMSQLLVDRLTTRRAFTSVALAGRGIAGDLQVNLSVSDFFHDATASPGSARVEVHAELIDRTKRRLVARQSFSATAPVAQANSAGAAAALGVASSKVLDQLVTWVETNATPAALATSR